LFEYVTAGGILAFTIAGSPTGQLHLDPVGMALFAGYLLLAIGASVRTVRGGGLTVSHRE